MDMNNMAMLVPILLPICRCFGGVVEAPRKGVYETQNCDIDIDSRGFFTCYGLAGIVMDRLGAMGQAFMHGHDPSHAIHYFAWSNLKGR